MKTTQDLLALNADERAAIVNRHAATAARLEDSGRKETGKTMAVMERAGDIGDKKDLKTYLKDRGIDVSKMKGVYEIARVARATLAGEIAMSEAQFDRAASSKLQILSRGFQDEWKHVLDDAVALVVADAPASKIRALFQEEKQKPALVIDDIPEDGLVMQSDKLRARLTADVESLMSDSGEITNHLGHANMLTRASRLFVLLASISGEDPHAIVDDVLATLAASQSETESAAAAA